MAATMGAVRSARIVSSSVWSPLPWHADPELEPVVKSRCDSDLLTKFNHRLQHGWKTQTPPRRTLRRRRHARSCPGSVSICCFGSRATRNAAALYPCCPPAFATASVSVSMSRMSRQRAASRNGNGAFARWANTAAGTRLSAPSWPARLHCGHPKSLAPEACSEISTLVCLLCWMLRKSWAFVIPQSETDQD